MSLESDVYDSHFRTIQRRRLGGFYSVSRFRIGAIENGNWKEIIITL